MAKTLDELAEDQYNLGQEIQRIITNFKKDPADRKTREYYQERISRIDDLWVPFVRNDINIKDHPNHEAHAYSTKNYYAAIAKIFQEYRDLFEERLKEIPSKSTTPTTKERQSKVQLKVPNTNDDGNNGQIVRLMRRQGAIMQSLDRLLTQTLAERQAQPRQYSELQLKSIEGYWSQVEQYHQTISELSDDPQPLGYDMEAYLQLEQLVQTGILHLTRKLELQDAPQQLSTPQHSTQINNPTVMNLPKITIPKFDGDYLKWRQFHDLFNQMINNQPMSGCQKLWYLKTNLSGEAERLIRHFSITDENYQAAWDMLKDRYNNSRLLVTALLNKLLAQPALTTESTTGIKALHDVTQECLLALENLGVSTTNWDPLLVHILIKKLDRNTHSLYEQSLKEPRNLQSLKELLEFLETRFQSLEALGHKGRHHEAQQVRQPAVKALSSTSSVPSSCIVCKDSHPLFYCKGFLQLSANNRLNLVRRNKLCVNCLKPGHAAAVCNLRGCKKCNSKHNSLLHIERVANIVPVKNIPVNQSTTPAVAANPESHTDNSFALATQANKRGRSHVLLGTALINISNGKGLKISCRAILDSGSQVNLITERVCKKLGLTQRPADTNIEGIGQIKQRAQKRVSVFMQSQTTGFSTRLEALVLPQIVAPQPTEEIDTSLWNIPKNIRLSDSTFNYPAAIDVLVGAEFYHQLLSIGQITLGEGLPVLQNSVLGWIVAGRIDGITQPTSFCGIGCQNPDINTTIERFWKLEEVDTSHTALTPAEKRCEEHFNQTVRRNPEGRFIVKLPFNQDPAKLGESVDIALRRFNSLEKKFSRHEDLKSKYIEFLEEYSQLGHMQEVPIRSIRHPYYFLPHHCVLKPDSSTTKLRVVFDASCKTSTNLSLNDVLATGPTIQSELFSILLRFRLPRFVFTADVEKMFRQIEVSEEDRKYQLIAWRKDPSHPMKFYQLNTVTYGTTSAPYLATKCLQRLGQDNAERFPLGSKAIQNDFYVDDLMTGSDSLTTALAIQQEAINVLQQGQFKLRKWCANHPRLLMGIPSQDTEVHINFKDGSSEEQIKTLGLTWMPKADSFCIKTTWNENDNVTKRTVASNIAHLFDPLGIMGPVVIIAKLFLQRLWELKLDWDAAIPQELHTRWVRFREGLRSLDNIKFPRHVFGQQVPNTIQMHVFADASERAYGAAVYLRSTFGTNCTRVALLCAKSRVAPVKKITLPRLELCAAKLASELAKRVKEDLKLQNCKVYYWTDSEIVLNWLNSASSSFQSFVANRIAAIQELSEASQWRHVNSKQNPADVLSRGLAPEKLEGHALWFHGPPFLHGKESIWPPQFVPAASDLEKKKTKIAIPVTMVAGLVTKAINHRNSFSHLQRITAYILRFVKNCKCKTQVDRSMGQLTVNELEEALIVLIKETQAETFKEELQQLKRSGIVHNASPISSLSPFVDENGIIRVGGRLEEANIPYDAKHPMLLPYAHSTTKMLMEHLHQKNSHAGPQNLLAITRERFWPLKGKTTARSTVQNCLRCSRAKPKLLAQFMGNLPPTRVQPARPFVNAGVDFCGPFWIHYKLRGKRPHKCYVAVFCCFATKATHLEVVSDLTTAAFIAALRRFTSRRGNCRNLYCDNATNFVGAKNQLTELQDSVYSKVSGERITTFCTGNGIDFHFIPPRSPHFGGLWEAAVKSAKHLLVRTVSTASLTYEELETVIVEIEGILNSRPLTSLSENPEDLSALTPGHFLIGEPLTSVIDPQAEPTKVTLLQRWKLVTHLKTQFWHRWTKEYLHELQHRYKWKNRCKNVQPGTMVVLQEDNLPVLSWQLGRIINTIKGQDGLVRVADVRTASGVLRRPIHKLAPLPIMSEVDTAAIPDLKTDQEGSSQTQSTDSQPIMADIPPDTNVPALQPEHLANVPEHPPSHAKRRRVSRTALTLSLLACLILPVMSSTSPVSITPFENQPGIYFEGMGPTHLISHEWNLVIYYNMTTYWQEYHNIFEGIERLNHICRRMADQTQCSSTNLQFSNMLRSLKDTNELLQSPPNARKKRAPLDIIGNIANSLFGVLDSSYAEKMSDVINKVEGNEKYLLDLVKNQTTLIDSTANIVRKSYDDVNQQLEEFHRYANRSFNAIQKELKEQQLREWFSSVSLGLILMISNYQRMQSNLLDLIIDTHHGKINPQLLTPRQLQEQLTIIKEHLPPTVRLPGSQRNLLQVYNLMTVQGRVVKNHIIFRARLPLFTYEPYELLRIIPIPIVTNGSYITIEPSTNYLIINLHRDQYYPLSEQELARCTKIDYSSYMCQQHHPIYKKASNVSICEVEFLMHSSTPPNCKLIRTQNAPRWIQLLNPNHWIYNMKDATTINLVCGNAVSQQLLKGQGMLTLQPGCVIKETGTTIQAHNLYPGTIRTAFLPSQNLTDIIPVSQLEELLQPSRSQQALEEDFAKLKEDIKDLQNEEATGLQTVPHYVHYFSLGYMTVLISLAGIGYIVYKYIKKRRQIKTHIPIPLPRRRQSLNVNPLDFNINPELADDSPV